MRTRGAFDTLSIGKAEMWYSAAMRRSYLFAAAAAGVAALVALLLTTGRRQPLSAAERRLVGTWVGATTRPLVFSADRQLRLGEFTAKWKMSPDGVLDLEYWVRNPRLGSKNGRCVGFLRSNG
jgi:hypothetical protein